MAVLVVVVLVMLVHVTHVLVVLLKSLAGAGGNPILFVLVNLGNGSRGAGRTRFSGGAFPPSFPTAAATATAATTGARITLFAAGFFHPSGSRGAIGDFRRGRFIHVEVVNPGQDVFLLQIGIEVQIEIKFARTGLFPADFIPTSLFAPRGRPVIPARSGRALVAAASVFTPGLFAARGRSFLTARRGDIATRGRSFFAATFRPAALLAPLAAAASALVAAAAIGSAVSATPFIPLARTVVPARLGGGLW